MPFLDIVPVSSQSMKMDFTSHIAAIMEQKYTSSKILFTVGISHKLVIQRLVYVGISAHLDC